MSERGTTMAVSDEDIARALESLFWEPNPNPNPTFTGILQQLQSKLGGYDLSHKVDFIRANIQDLFNRHHAQPPLLHQNHHFSLHSHRPNFQAYPPDSGVSHRPHDYSFRPPPPSPHHHLPQSVSKSEPFPTAHAAAAPAVAAASEPPKESGQSGKKRRGGPGGLNKLCGVSPELQTIVGQATLPRTEIVKQLWAYIRKHNLQDPNNKRKIICNDELRLVFDTDCTDMFKMNRLLAKHIVTLEPSKQTAQNPKRVKTEVESGSKSEEAAPVVIISEALANFLGTSEREMTQAEVLRQVWEYIKVNHLEDPLNAMVIRCDAKLQDLLGCESISALGIQEMLARHHLFKKS
ncbi:uncharacterized protein LOC107811957 [Nicotiana tabacum]|uniref:Uncharacterized protein LOC107811957 n=2 Tax=Nicotiana TaxID=4085 RepID=A0A1S4BUD8_TOBAC|nr:PREDICTED: uncharacterized protein LOC104240060 [Nicotiana sylvestris]XP_016492438.1 PREDICTED: uncharacterized protein LOC107811957 [Nicotiana tabacum]